MGVDSGTVEQPKAAEIVPSRTVDHSLSQTFRLAFPATAAVLENGGFRNGSGSNRVETTPLEDLGLAVFTDVLINVVTPILVHEGYPVALLMRALYGMAIEDMTKPSDFGRLLGNVINKSLPDLGPDVGDIGPSLANWS